MDDHDGGGGRHLAGSDRPPLHVNLRSAHRPDWLLGFNRKRKRMAYAPRYCLLLVQMSLLEFLH